MSEKKEYHPFISQHKVGKAGHCQKLPEWRLGKILSAYKKAEHWSSQVASSKARAYFGAVVSIRIIKEFSKKSDTTMVFSAPNQLGELCVKVNESPKLQPQRKKWHKH